MDDLCIHELDPAHCSICRGSVRGADPRAVAGGLKAAAARAGRVALPSKRFDEEVDAAIALFRGSEDRSARIIRAEGYESGGARRRQRSGSAVWCHSARQRANTDAERRDRFQRGRRVPLRYPAIRPGPAELPEPKSAR